MAYPGYGERRREQRSVGLDDGEQEDDERPEHEEVGDTRHWPAQQLALAEDVRKFRLDLGPDVLHAVGRRLAGRDQPEQKPAATKDKGQPDDSDS